MKATGIVRRIDSSVIIGAKVRSLENTGFSLIFVQLHQYPNFYTDWVEAKTRRVWLRLYSSFT